MCTAWTKRRSVFTKADGGFRIGFAVILSMLGASPSTVPLDAQKLSTTAILSAFAPPPGRKNDAA
jgi:hypothetical protein